MWKNVASQKLVVYCFDSTTSLPKTGDAANLTAYVSKDYGAVTILGDTSATELDATNAKGHYLFDLTQTETNADRLIFTCKSSTANIVCLAVPAAVTTTVMLGNVAHGGTAATVTAERVVVISTTAGEPGVKLQGATTGAGLSATGGASAGAGLLAQGGASGHGIEAAGQSTGEGISAKGGATGHGMAIQGGSTSGNGLMVTADNGHAASLEAVGGVSLSCLDGIEGYFQGDIIGHLSGNVTGNVAGTIGGLTAAALKDFFDTDTTTTYASAVAGSVVKEIATNAGGGTPPSAAVIADAVWDELRAGHVIAGSFGERTNAALANTAHGGVAATLTLERIIVASTTTNEPAMKLTGNGSGAGLAVNGGASGVAAAFQGGANTGIHGVTINASGTGNGTALYCQGGPTGIGISASSGFSGGTGFSATGGAAGMSCSAFLAAGVGLDVAGFTTGVGLRIKGGASGPGMTVAGGTTSGNGITVTTTSGHGLSITATGASMHGAVITGGTSGTSDGLKCVAGSGGVDIRGALTGNVTGNLSGTIGGLTAAALADFFDTSSGTNYASAVAGSVVKEIADNAGGSSLTAAAIADAVWDEARSGHVTAGTYGAVSEWATGGGGGATAAQVWDYLTSAIATGGSIGKLLVDNLNATVSSRASQASVDTLATYVDTEVAAIKAKTDNLPTDPADASDIAASFTAIAGKLDVIDDFLDTEVAAIKTKTDQLVFTTANRVDCQVYGMQTDVLTAAALATSAVTEIQAGLSTLDAAGVRAAVGLASANLDAQLVAIDDFLDTEVAAIKTKTDQLTFGTANRVNCQVYGMELNTVNASALATDAVTEIQTGLATAAALTVIDDFLDTEVAAIKVVTDKLDTALELDGAVYRYTVNALELAPTGGAAPSAAVIADAVWDELRSGHVIAGSFGEYTNAVLANGTHGGVAATLTLERIIVASTTTNEPAMKLTGQGSGAGIRAVGGSGGIGLYAIGNGSAAGLQCESLGNGQGMRCNGAGGAAGIMASGTPGMAFITSGNSSAITATGVGTGPGVLITGGGQAAGLRCVGGDASGGNPGRPGVQIVGGAASTTAGGTSAPGLQVTGGAGAASTNGAAVGATISGGGTNTVASNAHGLSVTGTSNGTGLATVGAGTGVGASSVPDATGFGSGGGASAAAIADAVWDEARSGHTTAGTYGAVSEWATGGGGGTTAAQVWDYLTSAMATGGSIGKLLVDNINATVSSRATQTSVDTLATYVDTEVGAIKAKTDNLPTDPADASDIAASFTTVNGKLDVIDDFLDTEVAAIKTKTDQLTFGTANRVNCQVFGMELNVVTAAALATDAVTEIQTGLATAASLATLTTYVDTEVAAIKVVTDKLDTALELDGAVYRYTTNALEQAPTGGAAPSAATIADAVWDEARSGHVTAGTYGAVSEWATSGGGTTAAQVWDYLTAAIATSGSIGKLLTDNINATVSSRLAPTVANRTLDVTATGASGIDWGNVENQGTAVALTNTTFSPSQIIASVTAPVTAGTVQDKTGYRLSAGGVDDFFDEVLTGHSVAGSMGKVLLDNLNAPVSSRLAPTVPGRTLDVSPTGASGVDWGNVEAPTTAVALTNTTISTSQVIASAGSVGSVTTPVTVGTITDKTGYELAPVSIDAIWDELQAGHTITGSFGKYLDSAVSGVSTGGLTPDDIADAIFDQVNGVEASLTLRQALRLVTAALLGVTAGVGTDTNKFRDVNNTTDRITTMFDASRNRQTVVLDHS